ncbi:MAG: sulfite exporter TauE/SafE family protein [Gammaproteobacteria bacterium]|nr:sulfite exporter TauE/SafE family protein [Gammaproteobacteria bacterium]
MAVLYSSVGHGGASGYLAAMALFSLAPESMRPAALVMNIFVAALVWLRLYRAGFFVWRVYLPLALAALPMAYIGGSITLSTSVYYYVVASALLLAAWQLFRQRQFEHELVPTRLVVAIPLGLVLGLVAGLTGIGGGVYLSPLLLMLRWTDMRTNAGVAAAFVLTNSLAGLAGYMTANTVWPDHLVEYVIAVVLGALIGSELAVRRLSSPRLKALLALVLVIAAIKMMATHTG